MSYLILKHLPALLLAAPVLAWAYLNLRTPRQARALLLAAAGSGAAVIVVVAAAALARVPTDGWSAARLAPPASLLRGYRLYYPPGEGPALVRMYGPVPWLLYAPAVALGRRPTAAMLAAAGVNLLCFALPVAWTLRRMTAARHRRVHGGAVVAAAGVAFGVVAALATQLTYTACAVTVDAPAIGFAACACTAAAAARGGRAALAAGLFASLAVWSKQTMWPFVLAPVAYVWLARPAREAARFAGVFVAVIAAVSLAAVLALGPRELWFNLYTVPSRHPWQWPWLETGAALRRAARLIARESQPAAIVLGVAMLLRARVRVPWRVRVRTVRSRARWRVWLRRNPWVVLVLAGLLVVPTSAAAIAKVGGRANNAAPTSYLLTLAAVVALASSIRLRAPPRAPCERTRLAVLAVTLLITVLPVASWRELARLRPFLATWARIADNEPELAFAYARRFPGTVYFPQHPLATLMAEGRLDHFEEGVRDLRLAGIDFPRARLLAGLPPDLRAVAYDHGGSALMLEMLGEFAARTTAPDLPGWTVYTKPD